MTVSALSRSTRRAGAPRVMERLARGTLAIRLFLRVSAMGFSILVPLLMAAVSSPGLAALEIVLLAATGVAFHGYSYVLNDVLDLSIDRLEPRRRDFPLVRGSVTRSQALAFAFVNIPLALACAVALGSRRAAASLGVAVVFATAYNLLAKRIRVPIVADAIQGCAWVGLAIFGALSVAPRVTPAAAAVSLFIFVYVLLANGIHGSLRDLAGDLAGGAYSTAIGFGARPGSRGQPVVPSALMRYAMALQALLVALAMVPFAWNLGDHPPVTRAAALLVILACGVPSVIMLARMRAPSSAAEAVRAGMVQLLLSFAVVLAACAPAVGWQMSLLLVMIFLLPAFTHSGFIEALGRMVRVIRGNDAEAMS